MRIYFVNGSLHDDSPVGKISHDFSCKKASEMKDEVVANQFSTIKQAEFKKMETFMQKVFDEGERRGEMRGEKRGEKRGRAEGEKTGIIKGKLEQLKEITQRVMASMNTTLEEAMIYLKLNDDEKCILRSSMA